MGNYKNPEKHKLRLHEWFKSLSPVIDGHINNVLQQTVPDINEVLLQLTDAILLIPVLLSLVIMINK